MAPANPDFSSLTSRSTDAPPSTGSLGGTDEDRRGNLPAFNRSASRRPAAASLEAPADAARLARARAWSASSAARARRRSSARSPSSAAKLAANRIAARFPPRRNAAARTDRDARTMGRNSGANEPKCRPHAPGTTTGSAAVAVDAAPSSPSWRRIGPLPDGSPAVGKPGNCSNAVNPYDVVGA